MFKAFVSFFAKPNIGIRLQILILSLAQSEYLLPFYWLKPGTDPYSSIKSKSQAARLNIMFFVQNLEITKDLSGNQASEVSLIFA
ncbi:MAG: hypothetical protein K0B14_06775 [Anaerolineaceae bacterium]|nr:hypothetical protein [Anaerolineaceae bacterium]